MKDEGEEAGLGRESPHCATQTHAHENRGLGKKEGRECLRPQGKLFELLGNPVGSGAKSPVRESSTGQKRWVLEPPPRPVLGWRAAWEKREAGSNAAAGGRQPNTFSQLEHFTSSFLLPAAATP